MIAPLAPIVAAYEQGYSALLVTGRSLKDLMLDAAQAIRPAIEVLRRELRVRYGIHLMTYSLAEGFDWDAPRIADARDRSTIEQALGAHNLLDVPQDQNEVLRVLRGIGALTRAPRGGQHWFDGTEMRFGVLLDFAEHLVPGGMTSGSQTDVQLIAVELAHVAAHSLALRSSGNLVIFHGRDLLVDDLIRGALRRVRLSQPGEAEKVAFIAAARTIYPNASFTEGVTPETVAHITVNTPNRGLESLLRASHRAEYPLTLRELTARQSEDVEALSDRSLVVLDPSRVAGVTLRGRNVCAAMTVLQRLAAMLRAGVPDMPANVLLSGSPGSGKTDLAIVTANAAGVTAYELRSPKRGIVGQTEIVANTQWDLLRDWSPTVAFVDEVTEAMPLQRSDFDGDSGASRAVTAALLTALSDETRRGRSLLVASTNCPWRMSDAMRSRFVVLPVLHPLLADLPAIIVSIASRLRSDAVLDEQSPAIVEAARLFDVKGATPRDIRQALTNAMLFTGILTGETVAEAARNMTTGTVCAASREYADLWAIRSCSYRAFLPWNDQPANYPYPRYLEGIINPNTGDVDGDALARRLEQLRPHANV